MNKGIVIKGLFVAVALWCVTAALGQTAAGYVVFLYKYMPLPDRADYSRAFYEKNVAMSLQARREMPWGSLVPEREFRHFVVPVRVNNETLDNFREVFYNELKQRVVGLGMKDAILEVNHWCHEKVTYRPSDSRTSSPLATVRTAYGRCGEESTFLVAALRTVGIPARQVYTPPLGPYRRQPRVGGGLGRRPVVVPGSLRTRGRAQQGMVQRKRLAWHADAHQGVRCLRRTGGGDKPHTLFH